MGKNDVIDNLVKRQVQPMIIVDNMIHHIINLNHMLIVTNVNTIVIIEQQNKLLRELITTKKKWINVVLLILEYLHHT